MKFSRLTGIAISFAAALALCSCGKETPAQNEAAVTAPVYAAGSPEAVAAEYAEAMLSGDYGRFIRSLRVEKQIGSDRLAEVEAKLEELFKPYLEVLKKDTQRFGGIEKTEVKAVNYPEGSTDEALVEVTAVFKDHAQKPHEDKVRLLKIDGEWVPALQQQ